MKHYHHDCMYVFIMHKLHISLNYGTHYSKEQGDRFFFFFFSFCRALKVHQSLQEKMLYPLMCRYSQVACSMADNLQDVVDSIFSILYCISQSPRGHIQRDLWSSTKLSRCSSLTASSSSVYSKLQEKEIIIY